MREIWLLRHGKSKWPSGISDFDRPLAGRGKDACTLMSNWMLDHDLVPDVVISSPAKRAKSTARRVCKGIGVDVGAIRYDESIYEAPVSNLVKALQGLPNDARRVLMVGHNPGFEGVIQFLCERYEIMPTAAFARMQFDGDWGELARGSATLLSVTRPRDFEGARCRR